MKKSFWPILTPIIECPKPQGTVYNSSEASVTITLGNLRSFLQDLRGSWKHDFLKKKRNYSSEVFSRLLAFDKPQGTVFISPEASLAITDKKLRSFLQDIRGCWKNNFWKYKTGSLSGEEKFMAPFFS